MDNLSIIIVTYKRKHFLRALLSQLNGQRNIFVVVNNESLDNYQEIQSTFSHVKFLTGNFKTPGLARNFALQSVQTQWCLFLDDDVLLPENYFQQSQKIIQGLDENTVCFGGPDAPPLKSNLFQIALSKTLESPMATAHTRLRHTKGTKIITTGKESNLILCHLWIKTSFLKENNLLFSKHLFRNEENLLISQILSHNGSAQYFSDLFVYHHRKTRIDYLTKAVFNSGKNRVYSFLIDRSLFHPLFLVPAAWVIYLVFLLSNIHIDGRFIPAQVYITLSVIMSMKLSGNKAQLLPLILLYQFIINIIYGCGVLWGFILGLFRRL